MEYPQSVPSAQPDDVIKKTAELACREFLQQIIKKQPLGLLSNGNNARIFSFETYLREKGMSEEMIQQCCDHVKSTDFLANNYKKSSRWSITAIWAIIKLILFTMCPGVGLYLFVAAFLWTFEISILKWGAFMLFALSGTIVFATFLFAKNFTEKRKLTTAGGGPQLIIKFKDSDELTWLKSKNKLFVEGKANG